MNAADIKAGKPSAEGRYVVFIQCEVAAARDWVEPVIMTWAGGKWHTTFLKPKIIGWLGPIPVMKVADIEPTPKFDSTDSTPPVEEYDL